MVIKSLIQDKRAQMKIQQMAIMLMAVTLFFVLVGMFVLVWSFGGLKESAAALSEENAMLLVTKLANSPEFSCGNSFGTGKINCIDADKVIALKSSVNRYTGFWGKEISNIEIRKVYPENADSNEIECSGGNYPNCNVIKLYDKPVTGNYIWNFVSLCRKAEYEDGIDDKCELAKVFVSYTK